MVSTENTKVRDSREGKKGTRLLQAALVLGVCGAYALILASPINFATADLGRHLKNGELFFHEGVIPSTNLYSFTHPDYPFVNHHWGSGAIFYLVHRAAGFTGLSVFFIAVSVATFLLFFDIGRRSGNFLGAAASAAVLLPLMGNRSEIRPELFSYFFVGLFFWILWNWREGRLNRRWLWTLPLAELLWVNIHVYFIFGIALIGLFLLDAFLRRSREWRMLTLVLAASGAATLINPNFIHGAAYPFFIFQNYGYRVLENQSVLFLERLLVYPPARYFKIGFGLVAASWVAALVAWKRNSERPSPILAVLAVAVSALGWLAVRNFTLFGYFALPIAAVNFTSVQFGGVTSEIRKFFITLFLFLALFSAVIFINPLYWQSRGPLGFGLRQGSEAAADFFRSRDLKGPLFNNYDIGGYLIYYLYPQERVFVDNRPEAYPASFFTDTYVPMQEQDEKWKEVDAQYRFNAIFFYRNDVTPWSQSFLIRRIQDPDWAPVFVDDSAIIFVRRGGANQAVIDQFELPKSMFSVSQQPTTNSSPRRSSGEAS